MDLTDWLYYKDVYCQSKWPRCSEFSNQKLNFYFSSLREKQDKTLESKNLNEESMLIFPYLR